MIIFITRFATSLPSYNLIPLFNLLGNTICGWCCGHTIHVTAARSQYLHLECCDPAAPLCYVCVYWKLILAGQLISGLQQQQHKNKIKKIFQGCQKYLRVFHRWHLRRWGRCSRGRSWCWRGCRGCWARLRLCPEAARRRSAAPPGHHNYVLSIIYYFYYLLPTISLLSIIYLLSIYLSPRQPRHGDLGRQVAVQRVRVQRWPIRVSVEVTWPVSTNHSSPDHSQ